MLRIFAFCSFLFGHFLLPAQASITFCPDLKSKEVPETKIGKDFNAKPSSACSYCLEASCQLALHDPIGGYEIGFFLRKDKEASIWVFDFSTAPTGNPYLLKNQLPNYVELNRFKVQGGSEGIRYLTIPLNDHLNKVQDEIQELYAESYGNFPKLSTLQEPFGDLAGIFEEMQVRERFARLTSQYLRPDNPSTAEIMDLMGGLISKALPELFLFKQNDSSIVFSKNKEFPQFAIEIRKAAKTIEWICYAPERKDAPALFFPKNRLRPSSVGPDTLVSSKGTNGTFGYRFGAKDESRFKLIKFNGKEYQHLQGSDTTWVFLPLEPGLNRTLARIEAEDIHGNSISKDVILIEHESEAPQIELFHPGNKSFIKPGDELKLDTYNNRFVLKGRIKDKSPVRFLKINGNPVLLEKDEEFNYPLSPSYNGRKIRIEAGDFHGNRVTSEFILRFLESGQNRPMRLILEEEFKSPREALLKQNGQDGLDMKFGAEKLFIKREVLPDTASSAASATTFESRNDSPLGLIVPLEFPFLEFNQDFELEVTFRNLSYTRGEGFCLALGIDEKAENFFFLRGEGDNLFLGQFENGKPLCLGEGCPQNYLRANYVVSLPFMYRQRVDPSFFRRGNAVDYTLRIIRFNQFYMGTPNDPGDWLKISLSNGVDQPIEMKIDLKGSMSRFIGGKAGFCLQNGNEFAIDRFVFKNGIQSAQTVFFDEKDLERVCFNKCYLNDTTKGKEFFDCMTTHYRALIVANGEFGGRAPTLDSALSLGRQLQKTLVEQYQFSSDNVTLLENATKQQFESQLERELPNRCGGETKLLIWVITHGTNDKSLEFRDASMRSANIWTSLNEKKPDGSPKYEAKQIVLVLDACFSGDMTINKEPAYDPDREACDIENKKSRIVLTAASSTPTGQGEFTRHFLQQLARNDKKFTSLDRLFDLSRANFIKSSGGVTMPTFTVFDPTVHDDKGSFLFVKKKFF